MEEWPGLCFRKSPPIVWLRQDFTHLLLILSEIFIITDLKITEKNVFRHKGVNTYSRELILISLGKEKLLYSSSLVTKLLYLIHIHLVNPVCFMNGSLGGVNPAGADYVSALTVLILLLPPIT